MTILLTTCTSFVMMPGQSQLHTTKRNRTIGTNGSPIVIAVTEDDNRDEDSRNLSYAKLTRVFNEDGRIVHQAYFDVHGKPMPNEKGYAAWRAVFDAAGNRIEVEDLTTAPEGS